jgi:hypothetical protein
MRCGEWGHGVKANGYILQFHLPAIAAATCVQVGAIDVDAIDVVWRAARKHGFRPAMNGWPTAAVAAFAEEEAADAARAAEEAEATARNSPEIERALLTTVASCGLRSCCEGRRKVVDAGNSEGGGETNTTKPSRAPTRAVRNGRRSSSDKRAAPVERSAAEAKGPAPKRRK